MKHRAVTNGTCKGCGQPYTRGSWIVRIAFARFVHPECIP